jgi:arginyl-tRNA synthetase
VPVIQAEGAEVQAARLRLVAASRQVLANALGLLVIQAPDVM